MAAVLKQSGNDLTRENLMKQAANIHDLKLPMLLPGIAVSTSANDFARSSSCNWRSRRQDLAVIWRGDLSVQQLIRGYV